MKITYNDLPEALEKIISQNEELIKLVRKLGKELDELRVVSSPLVGIKEAAKFVGRDGQWLSKELKANRIIGGKLIGGKWLIDLPVLKKSIMDYEEIAKSKENRKN